MPNQQHICVIHTIYKEDNKNNQDDLYAFLYSSVKSYRAIIIKCKERKQKQQDDKR
jgi:hypothetical protein